MEVDISWHKDGHTIEFMLENSSLVVVGQSCPNPEGECRDKQGNCLVRTFVDIYGLECNVGVAPIAATMEFAWAFVGDINDPINSGQLWIIPATDEIFMAWADAQNGSGPS